MNIIRYTLMILFGLLMTVNTTIAQIGISTDSPLQLLHVDPSRNTKNGQISTYYDDVVATASGNIGIGTITPNTKLNIVSAGTAVSPIPALRVEDGRQKVDYVLTADAFGNSLWKIRKSIFTQVDYHSKVLNLNIGPNYIDTDISIDFKEYGTYLLILGVRTVFTMAGVSMNVLQFRTQTAPDPKTVWESPSIGRIAGSYEMYGTSFHNDQDKRFYFTQTMTLDAATGTKVHLLMVADCPTAGSVTLSLGGTTHIETGGSYIRIN